MKIGLFVCSFVFYGISTFAGYAEHIFIKINSLVQVQFICQKKKKIEGVLVSNG